MIRRTFLLLVSVLVLASCQKEEGPGYNPPELAEQTVLLYMPGRSLLSFFENNIAGVHKAVGSRVPGQGRMLVCYQPDSKTSAELSEVYYDANRHKAATKVLKAYDTFNAGDPANVHQLLADAAAAAPAKKYGLIIGCHGKAWVPASAGGLTSRKVGERPATDAFTDSWEPMPGAKITRSFGDSGYELDITELAEAISAQAFKPEYLIFDDCFMASVEVFYDLRNIVPYVIASPCEIMGAGFPYDRMIPWLFTENGSSFNLGKACYEFWNLYMNDWESLPGNSREQSGCISLAVMSEVDALAQVMKRVNAAAKKSGYNSSQVQTYEGFSRHAFYDLEHYVELSCADPALVEEFKTTLERVMPRANRLYTPNFYSGFNDRRNPVTHYSGITTSDPSENSTVKPYIQQTAWYRATH